MRIIKAVEILLMSVAALLFLTGYYTELFIVLFLMGFQSTMFGPVKYAYIPQNLDSTELIGGNALVESGTYFAIICGLLVGNLAVVFSRETCRCCPAAFAASLWLVTCAAARFLRHNQ